MGNREDSVDLQPTVQVVTSLKMGRHLTARRFLLPILVCIIHSSSEDPMVFPELKQPSPASVGPKDTARSWRPVRGSVVFPPSSITNAGKLAYQRQDAAKREAEKDATRSSPVRQPKAFYFSDGKKSQPSTNGFQSDSGFRPSPEYPSTHSVSDSVPDIAEYSEPASAPLPFVSSSQKEETPAKALRHINKDEVPIVQVVQVQVTPAPLIDHSDFLEAMEQLVGRLDELEVKIPDSDETKEDKAKVSLLITEIKSAFMGTREKLEKDIVMLTGKTVGLEQRLSALEEITREWIDPNILSQDYLGKTNGKRGVLFNCPTPFFSLDENDPNSPCYFISNQPNFRKNWQDASTNCQEMKAKLAEPKTSGELGKLTDYLRYNRTDQLGGGYWTGGLNPGLMWLWPSSGSSLSNIDPDLWLDSSASSDTRNNDKNNGKCLRLTYDRILQRYALQGSDCQRYLYFVCEYDLNATASFEREQSFESEQSDQSFLPSEDIISVPTASPFPVNIPSTSETPSTTTQPLPVPTPNYVGVIGFKGVSFNRQTNVNPLNLAILGDGVQ